jgi:hypothetical protein
MGRQALVQAILGPITIQAMMRVTGDIHKSLQTPHENENPMRYTQ